MDNGTNKVREKRILSQFGDNDCYLSKFKLCLESCWRFIHHMPHMWWIMKKWVSNWTNLVQRRLSVIVSLWMSKDINAIWDMSNFTHFGSKSSDLYNLKLILSLPLIWWIKYSSTKCQPLPVSVNWLQYSWLRNSSNNNWGKWWNTNICINPWQWRCTNFKKRKIIEPY